MRPAIDRVMQQLAMTLMGEVAPLVSVDYVQRNTALISMLLSCVAEEWDRAAERRVEENRELRRILGVAAPSVVDGELRADVKGALRAA